MKTKKLRLINSMWIKCKGYPYLIDKRKIEFYYTKILVLFYISLLVILKYFKDLFLSLLLFLGLHYLSKK